jgi:hypothetical protein
LKPRLIMFCGLLLVSLAAIAIYWTNLAKPSFNSDKRLLEFGWNTPRLQAVPASIEAAQNTPFDGGLILDIQTPRHQAGLSWTLFGSEWVDSAALDDLSAQFAGFNWGRLTDNFLRVNVTPGDVDWFDDFDTILYNYEAVAKLAHDLGFAGIMLDTEQYNSGFPVFDYNQQRYRDQYTYDEYEAQVYRRGQDVMQALNRGYPGLTVLYTYGLTIGSQIGPRAAMTAYHYGLLIPFVEGMIAAADSDTVLVDAFEGSYGYDQEAQFQQAFDLITRHTRDSFARDPERYGEVMQAGFGLWIDHDCPEGLQPAGCPGGFSPVSFRQALELALRFSDRYVWVYSQRVPWYSGESLPTDWQQAIFS